MSHDDLHGPQKKLLEAAWRRYLADERAWRRRRRRRSFLGLLWVVVGLLDAAGVTALVVVVVTKGPPKALLLGVLFLVPLACWNVRLWWAYRYPKDIL